MSVVITQLVVDASGAKMAVADFEHAMERAKESIDAAGAATNTYERDLKRWVQSLAAADPAIRAQIRMKEALTRQEEINTRAVSLNIATQDAANALLDRVRAQHENLAAGVRQGTGALGGFSGMLRGIAPLLGLFGVTLSAIGIKRFGMSILEASEDGKRALSELGEAFNGLKRVVSPAVEFITNSMTGWVLMIGKVTAGIAAAAGDIARSGTRQDILTRESGRGSSAFMSPSIAAIEDLTREEEMAIFEGIKDAIDEQAKAYEKLGVAATKAAEEMKRANESALKELDDTDKFLVAEKAKRHSEQMQDELAAYEDLIQANEKFAATIKKQTDKEFTDRVDSTLDYLEERQRLEEDAIEQSRRAYENLGRDINESFIGAFQSFFETGKLDFESFMGDLKRIFARVMAEMAAAKLLQPLVSGMAGSLSSMFGGAAGAGSSIGAMGFGGFSGAGSILGPAAAVALGGSMIGSSLGGALGGSPTAGGIGGALFGGLPGAGLSLLFKGLDKPSNFTATAAFASGMGSAQFGGDKPNQATSSLALAAANAIMAEVAALKSFGVEFQSTISKIAIGARDPSKYSIDGGPLYSTRTTGDPAALAAAVLKALLEKATSTSPAMTQILGREFGSTQELTAAAQFVAQIYDPIIAAKPALTLTEQAMKALADQFKSVADQARSLGLDVAALGAGFVQSFDQDVRMAILGITDPLKYALELWKRDAQARLDAAAAIGGDLAQVQQLNSLLHQQVIDQMNAGLASGLTGLIASLQYGPGSAASPQSQYSAALADYQAAQAAALNSGTPAEISAFQSSAQSFLPLARNFLGTSEAYGSLVAGAVETARVLLADLATSSAPDLTPMVQATLSSGTAVVDAVDGVRAEVSALADEVKRQNATITSLLMRVS